jgi:hypothetical protein
MTVDEHTTETTQQPNKTRRWPWIVGVVAALIVGIGIGAASTGGETEPTTTDNSAEVQELQDRIAALESERDEALTQTAELEAQLADAQAQIEAAEAEPAEEPKEDTPAGDYTAGSYVFNDVQVSEDFAGDFEMRARVTNTGDSVSSVLFTATIFDGDTVVGTADGVVNNFDADATVTVEFISTDAYADWDSVEFQIQAEF